MVCILSILTSCSKDDQKFSCNLSETNNNEVLKEISILVGKTLNDEKVKTEISQIVDEIDSYDNAVSFALLLGVEQKISDFEKRKIGSSNPLKNRDNNYFKKHLNFVYNQNKDEYKNLSVLLQDELYKTSKVDLSDLEIYLTNNQLELYFPYKEKFNWEELINYTVTFENNDMYNTPPN